MKAPKHLFILLLVLIISLPYTTAAEEAAYITREDFYTSAAKKLSRVKPAPNRPEPPFADFDGVKDENKAYITMLYERGLLDRQPYLRPKAYISAQEALVFIDRLLNLPAGHEYDFTDGSISPQSNMTVTAAAALIERAGNYQKSSQHMVSTIAGVGTRGYQDGKASGAIFTQPYGVTGDGKGDLFVFDTYNNLIRKIRLENIETVAGSVLGMDDNRFPKGYYQDGALEKALFNRPAGGAVNSKGELFVADSANSVIRAIKDGKSYTFCGTGEGYADGRANNAMFNHPMAIAIDKDDNIYVADSLNNCIRKIDASGNAVTIAGQAGKEGYADGAANTAMFRSPSGIAVSDKGVIYVADTGNHKIRRLENGRVTTLAGRSDTVDNDGMPFGGFKDGSSNEAMFNLPMGLTLSNGALIIADSGNNRIRALSLSTGNVSVVAGNGEPGDRDGIALEAMLHRPMGVYVHNKSLYIADTGNNKLKAIVFFE